LENVRWLKRRFRLSEVEGTLPTRIACFDLLTRTLEWERILEPAGLNLLFSIHAAPTTS
jgi:hypothetical protein